MNKNQQSEDLAQAAVVVRSYEAARARRLLWEPLWRDCYDYALPQRSDQPNMAIRRMEKLYDGTALDCVDQLAASLLGHITPPWAPWFGFQAGTEMDARARAALAPILEKTARTLQAQLDRSNFTTEIHQCFLDLVVAGTACLAVEESAPGAPSAYRFTAVPLSSLVLDEDDQGRVNTIYRTRMLGLEALENHFDVTDLKLRQAETYTVLESVQTLASGAAHYRAVLMDETPGGQPLLISDKKLGASPFIAFRWSKSAGEVYGRSPIMTVLPDVKVANKVVELVLKNASIAVTGIWQADDDGVLNPATIELVPGAIIPKAVGSQGLKPLEMPGRFDISQIVLDQLRARIRHALLTDRLSSLDGRKMTATEVLERASEMTRLLGATYGRLSSELMTPLVQKLWEIARRRGLIPDLSLDGRQIALEDRAPLAIAQRAGHVQSVLSFVSTAQSLGESAFQMLEIPALVTHLADALGLPKTILKSATQTPFLQGENQ